MKVNNKIDVILRQEHREFVNLLWRELGKLGWTPTDLARNSGISQSSISRIVNYKQTNLTESTKRTLLIALQTGDRPRKVIKMSEETLIERLVSRLERENDELKAEVKRLRALAGEEVNFMDETDESLKANGTTGSKDKTK